MSVITKKLAQFERKETRRYCPGVQSLAVSSWLLMLPDSLSTTVQTRYWGEQQIKLDEIIGIKQVSKGSIEYILERKSQAYISRYLSCTLSQAEG